LVEGLKPDPAYFDGDSIDEYYFYEWFAAANASPSKRTPKNPRDPRVLVWPLGKSGLDYLMPLTQLGGLRLVCDEQRRWTLRDADYLAPGAQEFATAVNLIDG